MSEFRHTVSVQLDHEQCYRAFESRDRRFDGCFVAAVTTTRIYCRPSCPAVNPKRQNVEFYVTAAAAQQRGFRACKRCRPDATPGSPEWASRADAVARAMLLIADGVVDREGVGGLAGRLHYSERQMNRLLVGELGAGPLALARAQRAQTARLLIETTSLPITDIAFAAGFSSVRQFNDTIREVYATTPSQLRQARRPAVDGQAQISVRLAARQPLSADALFGFLAVRAVPGVEAWDGKTYWRSMRLERGNGVVALGPEGDTIRCRMWLDDVADAQSAVQRCRRLLDLDADPVAIDDRLRADPLLAPLVAARPGLRSPGHPDGAELLTRAVLGQQVSVGAARTLAARIVAAAGEPLANPIGPITHVFPDAAAIASLPAADLAMPRSRAAALVGANRAIADGSLELGPGSDRLRAYRQLCTLPGIGPWTASYVLMRALNDPDAFLPTDIGVRNALRAAGRPGDPKSASAAAESWRPWRSYALHHLWASL